MGSGNVPREIYIVGILIFFVFFNLIYASVITTLSFTNPDYDENEGCYNIQDKYTGKDINLVTSSTISDDAKGLFESNLFRNIRCAPDYVNIIFLILFILTIILLVLAVIHG